MPQNEKPSKTEYLLTVWLALVLAAFLLLFIWVDFRGFARMALADMYEDTLAARLIWEARSLFPRRFLFGNQFYVIATPVFAALFYGLTGSMNTAMALATTLMTGLTLLAMDSMLRPVLKRPWQRLAALLAFVGLLFGPGSVRREEGAQLFFVMCSYYACYVITGFVVMGDYVRARASDDRRLPALMLAAFLCFCTGMQSLRQTCVTILPLLAFECFGALRRALRRAPLFPRERRPLFCRVGVYTAANVLGIALIKLIHPRQHTIYRGASVFRGSSLQEELEETRRALSAVTGFDYAVGPFDPVFFSLMFACCLLLIIAAFLLILRHRKESCGAGACFWLLSMLACLAVIAASFFTSVSLRAIYLFPWYTLPALSYVILAGRLKPGQTKALTLALSVLAAVNLYFSYYRDVNAILAPDPTPSEEVCQYALDHGFTYVYGNANFTAPQIAVHSDGALLAGCWEDECIFKVSPHINIRDIYSLSDYKNALFVFLPYEMEAALTETEGNGAELTFCGEFGQYQVYTSSKQLLYPITETIDWNPEYN